MSTPSDYLSALGWGVQASAGAAVSAETTTTLGTDRLDTRVPPDQYRISGLQLARMRTLLQTMSEWYQGGSRLRLLKLSANPFSASQYGLFADNATTPNLKYYDGTNNNHVAAAPLTTKGDLIAFNGTNFLRLAVGANDTVLTADSAQTGGIKWATVTATGDIEGVTAGAGLTGGGTSGTVTLDVGAGTGITVNANDVAVDTAVVATTTNSISMSNKTLTSPIIVAISTSTSNGTYTCGAADGASAAALTVDTTSAWANASARNFVVKNNGSVIFGIDTTGNLRLNSGGGAALTNSGNTIAVIPGASDVAVYGGAFRPYDDNLQTNGTSTKRWTQTWSNRYATKEKAVTFSATPAFDPADGNHQTITMTGNITSWTFAAGLAGEVVTIEFIQDGSGSRTLAGADTNIILAGGALTLTVTASKRDAITFRYNATAAKWYEIARSLNL